MSNPATAAAPAALPFTRGGLSRAHRVSEETAEKLRWPVVARAPSAHHCECCRVPGLWLGRVWVTRPEGMGYRAAKRAIDRCIHPAK